MADTLGIIVRGRTLDKITWTLFSGGEFKISERKLLAQWFQATQFTSLA
jgi:hypothetical protein